MRLLTFILTIFISYNCLAQCDGITSDFVADDGPNKYATLTQDDGIRKGEKYKEATIFYPSELEGSLPAIILCPGFSTTQKKVQLYGDFFASHGIICMTIGTNSVLDPVPKRVDALLDAVETIKQEDTREGSPLFGRINTNNLAVGGFSMGGGAAQLAAKKYKDFKAVFVISPWIRDVSTADLKHHSPILIISSEKDYTAPPKKHARKHFALTPTTTPKLLFEFKGQGHEYCVNNETFAQSLSLAWLKYYLYKDPCYCNLLNDDLLQNPSEASSGIIASFDCMPLSADNEINDKQITIYPNPSSNFLTIDTKLINNNQNYNIYSSSGQIVRSGVLNYENNKINISDLTPNIYFIKINGKTIEFIKSEQP